MVVLVVSRHADVNICDEFEHSKTSTVVSKIAVIWINVRNRYIRDIKHAMQLPVGDIESGLCKTTWSTVLDKLR